MATVIDASVMGALLLRDEAGMAILPDEYWNNWTTIT